MCKSLKFCNIGVIITETIVNDLLGMLLSQYLLILVAVELGAGKGEKMLRD